jgi:hypothetical protein
MYSKGKISTLHGAGFQIQVLVLEEEQSFLFYNEGRNCQIWQDFAGKYNKA